MKLIEFSSYVYLSHRTYVISLFGKLIVFALPTIRSIKSSIKNRVFNFFCIVKEDYDCDGVTLTIEDRLTGGWIYSAYLWIFTRVGGSTGAIIHRFGRPYKNND